MRNEELQNKFWILFGVLFYFSAKIFARLRRWLISEKLYSLSQSLGYMPRQSLINRINIMQINQDFLKQKYTLESYLAGTEDVELTKRLARCYIHLELYKDALRVLHEPGEDEEKLDLFAIALAKQGDLTGYISVLEKLFTSDTSVHRHNQLFFAYGRVGSLSALTPLLKKTLTSSLYSDQQKERFIRASTEGLLRSFHFDQVYSLYIDISEHYTSPLLAIHAGMSCEILGKTDKALDIYNQVSRINKSYAWWTTTRVSGILYRNGQYKKSYLNLLSLFGDRKRGASRYGLSIEKSLDRSLAYASEKNYKAATRSLFDVFPGWNIGTWNDHDDTVFKEYFLSTINLLSGKKINLDNYLSTQEAYSLRLASKRLWETSYKALDLTATQFEQSNKQPPESILVQLARSLTNSNNYASAEKAINKGLELFPSSLDLYIERAHLYTKQSNIYKSKSTWDYIFHHFNHKQFPPNVFTAAAEANLMSLDLDSHEKIISIAKSIFGKYNRTLSYYTLISTCTKLNNLNVELSTTGGASFSKKYTKAGLFSDLNKYLNTATRYDYNDEMTHRIKHRCVQAFSLIIADTWNESKDIDKIKPLVFKLKSTLSLSLPDSFTETLFEVILSSKSPASGSEDELRKDILKLKLDNLSFIDWIIVHQLLVSFRFLHLGYLARENSIQSILDIALSGPDITHFKLQKMFHAAIELCDDAKAEGVLELINQYYPEHYQNNELLKFFNITSGQYHRNETPNTPGDTYTKLVTNKSVAIVGPAPSSTKQGREIDSHDTVVRFNYRGKDSGSESSIYGSKTTISYQNGPIIRSYMSNSIPGYMKDLDVYNVEFVLNRHVEADLVKGNARKNMRRVQLFNGSMMAVPIAVMDTLQFSPKKVSVYGSNFYFSKNQYNKSYRDNHNKETETEEKQSIHKLLELVGPHDLIAQKRFIKKILSTGQISVDEECLRVLNVPDEEYMKQMEDLYSHY